MSLWCCSKKNVRTVERLFRICFCRPFRRRATVIAYRHDKVGNLEVLLISSSSNKHKWTLPGGGVEGKETYSQAANRELMEEAGCSGKCDEQLGEPMRDNEKHIVTELYPVLVDEIRADWPESHRAREWFQLVDAERLLRQSSKQRNIDALHSFRKKYAQD